MAYSMTPRLVATGLIVLLSFCGAVFAQDPAEKKPDATAQETEKKPDEAKTLDQPLLEEMVVTAQKRTENAKDVPVAVTAVTDEAINTLTTGGADVKALSGRVPSLLIESSFGRAFPRFYIRGLGNTDFDLNASQPVSMIYDEVVLENPVVKGMPVWDLDRIEVLRGPQGTLFGRNTPAGIVKFESKKPSQDFEAYAQGSYGTFSTTDIKGAVGGGITKTLSARFSFLYQSQDDWVDNGFTGKNNALGGYRNKAYRLQFLWGPAPNFSALLNVHGWSTDGTARIFRANMIEKGTDRPVHGFDQEKVFQDGKNQQKISSHGAVLKSDYRLEQGTVTSVTGYEGLDMFSRGDIDGGFGASFAPPFGPGFIPFPSESSDGIPNLDQFTEELRYASNLKGNFQWLVGGFYFREALRAETFSYTSLAPGNPVEGFAFQTQKSKSWAGFGSVDLLAAGRWKLKAGLRFTHDQKDFAAQRPIPLFFNTATVGPVRANTDDNFTNWDLSATYIVSPNANLYGRIGTGSRAPAIQGRILFAPDSDGGRNPATNGLSVADREDLLSEEVGLKTELFNRNLRLNNAIYHYSVDGQQITAVGGQFNTSTLLNAKKTEGYGIESDIDWAPSFNWLATIGLSYNHTEIKDPNLTVTPCGGGCTVLDPVVNGLARVNGNSLPHAPKFIVNGILDYKVPVSAGQFTTSLDWSYYSKKQFFLYESKEFQGDGFELGLRAGYNFKRGPGLYGVSVYGRNVTDQVIIQNGIDFNNLTGMTNDPANFGVEFSAKF